MHILQDIPPTSCVENLNLENLWSNVEFQLHGKECTDNSEGVFQLNLNFIYSGVQQND